MAIRVTHNEISQRFQNDISTAYARMAHTQSQLTSGLRIERPSDDPYGTSQVLDLDAQLSDIRQYQSTVADATTFLDTADQALDTVGSSLQRLRELVLQASNGTNGQASLDTIAAEIIQLKESVRDGINARVGNSYVFSGTASDVPPYAAPGNAYAGNNVAMNRRVSPGSQVSINMPGVAVLGTTTGAAAGQLSTLDLIDRIVADLQTGSPASLQNLRTVDLAALDARLENAIEQRTNLGAVAARLEATAMQLGDLEERLISARSKVAEVDFAKTYSEFQNQQTTYQASLAAGTRMLQTSILDFI